MSKRASLRSLLDKEKALIMFGAFDALSARLVEQAGCGLVFVAGFPVVGARYGVPDLGLRAFSDIASVARDVLDATSVPVIVDADDGYGDVKNVLYTVHSYERMGASAIVLEDQRWPKRCGHLDGKAVVSVEEMEAKVRIAASEKLYPDTMIVARTDARAVHGLDDALLRAERYLRAGADILFIEAPQSMDELIRIGRAFDVPQMATALQGGKSPVLTPREFRDLGFDIVGYGITLLLRAVGAMRDCLNDIMTGQFALMNQGVTFDEYQKIVGLPEWQRLEAKYSPNRS